MAVRVLRLLEYVYETADVAEVDMACWRASFRSGVMQMKSAVIQDLNWTEPGPPEQELRDARNGLGTLDQPFEV
jgi:hypothetical protein